MLNTDQYDQLLKPLNSGRVATRERMSYLEAWDVKAHLIRIFGFGGFSADVLSSELVFDDLATTANKSGKFNHDVAYKVMLRLTIHGIGPDGQDVTYTEAAIGASHQPDRAEAHDMAVKTAESDALKRAAINLGTQFGLSLYNSGATRDVVGRTLRTGVWSGSTPTVVAGEAPDLEQEIPAEQRNPEGESPYGREIADDAPDVTPPDGLPEAAPQHVEIPADSDGAQEWIDRLAGCVTDHDVPGILALKKEIAKARVGTWMFQGQTLAKWVDLAVIKAGKK
jgi:hypothetical protein